MSSSYSLMTIALGLIGSGTILLIFKSAIKWIKLIIVIIIWNDLIININTNNIKIFIL